MINVYRNEDMEEVVARVEYNEKLDYWDGRNRTNGGVGKHLGIAKIKSGEYVLIYGTQWQGQRDYAEIVSKKKALNEILKSGNDELLEEEKFKDLKELAIEKGLMDSELK